MSAVQIRRQREKRDEVAGRRARPSGRWGEFLLAAGLVVLTIAILLETLSRLP